MAVVVVNAADGFAKPVVQLDASASGLPKHDRVYRIDERGRKAIGSFRGKALRLTPELAPLEACVLEWARD